MGRKSSTQVEDMWQCKMRPSDQGTISSLPFCKSLHDKFCFKLLVFLLLCGLDSADLISDWLLFRDVIITEKGLVYGPPLDSVTYTLLAFSIIGTVTFILEVVNLWWDIFRNNPWVDADLMSAITIWIEDVPQIVINIIIVICREEAISYFQLVKASVIITGCVIRVIVSLFRYCSKAARRDLECAKENADSRRHVVYRVFIMLGLFINLGGAIAIFMFTQSERNPNGSINLKVPHSVLSGVYDEEKYFNDVSAYFSHPILDYAAESDQSKIPLLRLAPLSNLREQSQDHIIKIQYDKNPTKVVHWEGRSITSLTATECFEIDSVNKKLKIGSSCPTYLTSPTTTEIIIKFHYVKAHIPGLVFGNILYNIRVHQNNKCLPPSFSTFDDLGKRIENVNNVFLRYYRTKDSVSDVSPVVQLASPEGQFFFTKDLIDIATVWRTGFGYCDCTGSLSPVLDESIQVDCT